MKKHVGGFFLPEISPPLCLSDVDVEEAAAHSGTGSAERTWEFAHRPRVHNGILANIHPSHAIPMSFHRMK